MSISRGPVTETVANIFQVNNSKAMEKIIRDEKLHQKKGEERLKKQDPALLCGGCAVQWALHHASVSH